MKDFVNMLLWIMSIASIASLVLLGIRMQVVAWGWRNVFNLKSWFQLIATTMSQTEGKKTQVLTITRDEPKKITITGLGVNYTKLVMIGVSVCFGLLVSYLIVLILERYVTTNVSISNQDAPGIIHLLFAGTLIALSGFAWSKLSPNKITVEPRTAVPLLVQGELVRSQIHKFTNPQGGVEIRTEFVMVSNKSIILPPFASIATDRKMNLDEFRVKTLRFTTSTHDNVQISLEVSSNFMIENPGLALNLNNVAKALEDDLSNGTQDLVQCLDVEEVFEISGDSIKILLHANMNAVLEGIVLGGHSGNITLRDCLYTMDAVNELYENYYLQTLRERDKLGKVLIILFNYYTVLKATKKTKANELMAQFLDKLKPVLGKMQFRCQRAGVRWITFNQLEMNYADETAKRAAQQVAIAKLTAIAQNTLNVNLAERAKKLATELRISRSKGLEATQLEFEKIQKIIIDSAQGAKLNVFVGDNKKK